MITYIAIFDGLGRMSTRVLFKQVVQFAVSLTINEVSGLDTLKYRYHAGLQIVEQNRLLPLHEIFYQRLNTLKREGRLARAKRTTTELTFAAVKSAPWMCLASITTGMELEPCLTPAFDTTDLTYSTEGKARLLSGVISR